jgi:hypothetical protein
VLSDIFKPIIRLWEEIINKHKTRLGYKMEVIFHIPDYSKPIKFQGVGFLQENSSSLAPVQYQIPKCQHCHRVGHMDDQCFDLHPCEHCENHNHHLDKCSKRKKLAILNNHYEWITSWQWSSITKKIYRSYRRIDSRVFTHLVVEIFSSSHLVPDNEDNISDG